MIPTVLACRVRGDGGYRLLIVFRLEMIDNLCPAPRGGGGGGGGGGLPFINCIPARSV